MNPDCRELTAHSPSYSYENYRLQHERLHIVKQYQTTLAVLTCQMCNYIKIIARKAQDLGDLS